MAKQTINNTPADSGLGDSLKVSMDKINANFTEVYNNVASISGATVITTTSQLTNDGADGTHPFITIEDVPTSIAISGVTGLETRLSNDEGDIAALQTENGEQAIAINDLNDTITTLTGIINTQNGQISTMQGQIADLYNIINNL